MSYVSTYFVRLAWGSAIAFSFYLAGVISVDAASYTPSTVYPGTSYTVTQDVYNSNSYPITVRVDWFWRKNNGSWNSWCSGSYTIDPYKSKTSECGSSGDVAGTQMEFQVNTWWTPWYVTWSNTGFTVQSKPTLYASASGSGTGTISGSGINCGSGNTQCTRSYDKGATVSLSASAYANNDFLGWSGACSGTNSGCSFTIDSDNWVSARFEPVTYYNISVSAGANGSLSGCTNCGSSIRAGSNVSATASANSGYRFTGWSGGPCRDSTTNPCSFTANGNVSMTANFAANAYTLSTNVTSGSGTISGGGTYNSGTVVSVSATPANSSYTFSGWGGACSGTGGCSVTMDANKSVSASFSLVSYTLSVSKTGSGSGTVTASGIACGSDCSESYTSGTSVTLSASPASGSYFTGWSGNCSGIGSCTLTMDGSRSVTANFAVQGGSSISSYTETGLTCHPALTQSQCSACSTGSYIPYFCPPPISFSSPASGATYTTGQSVQLSGSYGRNYGRYNLVITYGGVTQQFSTNTTKSDYCESGDESSVPFNYGTIVLPNQAGPTPISFEMRWTCGAAPDFVEVRKGTVPVTVVVPAPTGLGVTPYCYNDQGVKGNFPFHEANSLSWTGPSGATGYYVYRRNVTTNSGFARLSIRGCAGQIGVTGCTDGLYTQSDGYISSDYEYKVTAVNSAGAESGFSNTVFQDGYSDGYCGTSSGGAPNLKAGTPTIVPSSSSGLSAGTFYAGSNIRLDSSIQNVSTSAGTGVGFKNEWRYYNGTTPPASVRDYPSEAGIYDMGALGAGASQTSSHAISGVTEGTWYLGVCTDWTGAVGESYENDNCSGGVKVVVKPKLFIPQVSLYVSKNGTCGSGATAQAVPGTKVTLCWKVEAK